MVLAVIVSVQEFLVTVLLVVLAVRVAMVVWLVLQIVARHQPLTLMVIIHQAFMQQALAAAAAVAGGALVHQQVFCLTLANQLAAMVAQAVVAEQ